MVSTSAAAAHQVRLLLLAHDAATIHRRFGHSPQLAVQGLSGEQLQQVLQGADAAVAERMLAAGLLRAKQSQWELAIPTYSAIEQTEVAKVIATALTPHREQMQVYVEDLQQAWLRHQEMLPAWDSIAHSLLIGYLLWGVGSHLLLAARQSSTLACLVVDEMDAIGPWLSFTSCRHDVGLTLLVGQNYPYSWQINDLLSSEQMRQTLGSVNEQKELIVYGDQTMMLMRRLAGYRLGDKGRLGAEISYLAWPILADNHLELVQQELSWAAAALRLLLAGVLPPALQHVDAALSEASPDAALVIYLMLVGQLMRAWQEVGLLPPVPELAIDDLLRRKGHV